jgi:four helix bundle protein
MSVTLRDQLLRAAASVASNIIEGVSHESRREFARFLRYSVASASEVEGHAQLAFDLGMMSEADFKSLQGMVIDVRKMLYGLLKRVKQST